MIFEKRPEGMTKSDYRLCIVCKVIYSTIFLFYPIFVIFENDWHIGKVIGFPLLFLIFGFVSWKQMQKTNHPMTRNNILTINSQWKNHGKSWEEDTGEVTRLRKPTKEEIQDHKDKKKASKREKRLKKLLDN